VKFTNKTGGYREMNWRNIKKLGDFAFEAVFDHKGEKFNTLVRELQLEDSKRLVEIVRNYSRNATLFLYEDYCKDKEQLKRDIRDVQNKGLNNTLDAFDKIGQQYSGDMQSAQGYIGGLSDEQLFSPYGPIQAPFAESVEKYINKAIDERNKQNRDTFRMGIEIGGRLVGGFVFDFIKKMKKGYRTIGDIGVYTENTKIARIGWRCAVYPVIYFINTVVKGHVDESKNLYISATAHPCNSEALNPLRKVLDFIGPDEMIPTKHGLRKLFVCKYVVFAEHLLAGNFLPSTTNCRIKITNTLVDEEIDRQGLYEKGSVHIIKKDKQVIRRIGT
jgi:hypothetical protein